MSHVIRGRPDSFFSDPVAGAQVESFQHVCCHLFVLNALRGIDALVGQLRWLMACKITQL